MQSPSWIDYRERRKYKTCWALFVDQELEEGPAGPFRGPSGPAARDFRPYYGDPGLPEDCRMQLDVITAVIVTGGVTVGVGLAVLAGKLSARVFFDASSRKTDEEEPIR